jgi:hypothetical protein
MLTMGTKYLYAGPRINFTSNSRNRFYYAIQTRLGQYFNGTIISWTSSWSYRLQPFAIFSLDLNYTRIHLPSPYNRAGLWVVGPKADLSFSKSLFFTAYLQYNNQDNNVNLNARFQWRFKPVSDLFIVYTDNYFATDTFYRQDGYLRYYRPFQPKDRAIVLKLTYWLNL